VRHRVETDLKRDGDLLLNLFGSVAGPLSHDDHLRVHHIWISLYRELLKAIGAPNKQDEGDY